MGTRQDGGTWQSGGGAKSAFEFHFLKYITNQIPLGGSEPSDCLGSCGQY